MDTPIHGSVTGATSPWFARAAADLLESGNIKEALRICVEGTRVFPRYTTGRLLLGRCYEALGSNVEAMLEYTRVLEVFPDNPLVRELVDHAEQREEQGFDAFAAELQARLQGRKDRLTFEEYVGTPAAGGGEQSMEQIIQQLEGAPRRIPVQDAPPAPEGAQQIPASPARFVTATLAEIYASQGEYDEAIEAYRTLAAQRPGSAERYQKRLAELEEMKKNAAGTR
ncbi:MAG TPA: tetratricopeptide repeat protein [Bacteroidota bacterium]